MPHLYFIHLSRIRLFTPILIGCLLSSIVLAKEAPPLITLRFQDTPTKVVLQAIAEHQQLSLVISDAVTGQLTLQLNNVPWRHALEMIQQLQPLHIEIKDSVMLVTTKEEFQWSEQQKQEALQKQKPLSQLMVNLNYNKSGDLLSLLEQGRGEIISERAKIIAITQTNQLLIHDYPEYFEKIKQTIASFDKPTQQVEIIAHIVTMSHDGLNELGVKWGLTDTNSPSIGLNNLSTNLAITPASIDAGINIARLNGRLLSLELSALELERQVDIIASPRLLTSNNQTASIKQGTELPYEVSSGSNGSTSVEFKSAALGLEVTPQILPDNTIILTLTISQNTPGMTIKQSNGGEVMAIDTQEIKTQVIMTNNETLVLGGVFQHKLENSTEKVPILGDIPLINTLFSRTIHRQSKRELIIFITPRLLNVGKSNSITKN